MFSTRLDWIFSVFGVAVLGWCCCAEVRTVPTTKTVVDCQAVCEHLAQVGCIEGQTAICPTTCREYSNDIKAGCLLSAPTADTINDCSTISCTLR